MKRTKRELVRATMYMLARELEPLAYDVVAQIKALGKAYNIDVYDVEGLVDGEMAVVGTQIEDDWVLNKGFAQTDIYDEERREWIFKRV